MHLSGSFIGYLSTASHTLTDESISLVVMELNGKRKLGGRGVEKDAGRGGERGKKL